MKSKKILMAALVAGLTLSATSCRDDFAETNTNPSAVVKGDLSYLFAEAVNRFDPQPYLEYYYNAPMKYAWAGMSVPVSGVGENVLTMSLDGDQSYQYQNVLRVQRAMENEYSKLDEALQKQQIGYIKAAEILSIYLGIFATDLYGAIPYTEACNAAYGGTLKPKFDMVEDLYNLWLTNLDDCIKTFEDGEVYIKSEQDVVYGGDKAKWAKLANSMKLRIAVRLLTQNPTKAKQIANEVETASCGFLNSNEDDMLFTKGKQKLTGDDGYVNDRMYHWSNDFDGCAGSQSVINFMVENKDPRVRFFYNKNQWNSKVVQGYYDAGLEIPDFIEKNVEYTTDANGKKKFVKWKGMGEPWVRYYGQVEDYSANLDVTGKYKWYFPSAYSNADKELYLHNSEGKNPTGYTVYSTLNKMMIIGRNYTAPAQVSAATLPDDTYTFTTLDRPWYGLFMSAAETNLYLAEFAMLNGDEAKAKTYYDNALACSCRSYDTLAEDNQVAYYSTVTGCFGYDKNEGAIDLKDGEIEAMMASDKYAFTGTAAEKLEKIYLQEMLNFTLYPNEVYVTARRSGYPSFNSTILPRKAYAEIPAAKIPRRFPTGNMSDTDIMRSIKEEAYKQQGLTITTSGLYNDVLATERLWQDKNAPEWGAGAK